MFTATHDIYDALYGFRDWAAEARLLTALIERHHPRARTLLDVGCATGLHLAGLAERFDVAGVDVDERLLEQARARLPGVTFAGCDMSELDLKARYDVLTCLYASIAYVRTEPRLCQTLSRFAQHLAPGGICVVQPWYRSVERCPLMQVRHVDLPELKVARLGRTTIDADLATIDVRYLVGTADGVENRREQHVVGIFSDATYLRAFAAAGLRAELVTDALGADADAFVGRAR